MAGGRNEYNIGGTDLGSGYGDAQYDIRTWENGLEDRQFKLLLQLV